MKSRPEVAWAAASRTRTRAMGPTCCTSIRRSKACFSARVKNPYSVSESSRTTTAADGGFAIAAALAPGTYRVRCDPGGGLADLGDGIFPALAHEAAGVRIATYGVSVTTLEEVFLRVE